MSLIEKFRSTIEKQNLIQYGQTLIVAVSGGADSVCLLHLLNQLKKDYELNLIVAHLNHKLRGKDSDLDEKFVKSLCKKWNLKCITQSIDIRKLKKPGKSSLEEIGRETRYQLFLELAHKYHAPLVVLAHHADDQMETVLMRLIRGTGPDGLRGMAYKRTIPSNLKPKIQNIKSKHETQNTKHKTNNIYIIRPLLDLTREEILDYLKKNKLFFREDKSNKDTSYLRNRIRHKLIPFLEKEFNPKIRDSLSRTSHLFTDEEEFWDDFLCSLLESQDFPKYPDRIQYPLDNLINSPIALQRRMIRYLLEYLQGHLRQIDYSHIDSILEMVQNPTKKSTIQLPGEYSVSVKNDNLIIEPKKIDSPILKNIHPLPISDEIKLEDWEMIISTEIHKMNRTLYKQIIQRKIPPDTAYLDFDKIKLPLLARPWKPGDKFTPLGMKHSKKLQDFFVDRKIPLRERHLIPIIEDMNGIIWVTGLQISEQAKVTLQTNTLLKIHYHKIS